LTTVDGRQALLAAAPDPDILMTNNGGPRPWPAHGKPPQGTWWRVFPPDEVRVTVGAEPVEYVDPFTLRLDYGLVEFSWHRGQQSLPWKTARDANCPRSTTGWPSAVRTSRTSAVGRDPTGTPHPARNLW